ncbi:MAG: hypothetical protein GXP49_00220 [Deltaproteobacteria bacterium]|nr:hypothetical protein [Deltaproteobacteria bacterium]
MVKNCSSHPERRALYRCKTCGKFLCKACIGSREVGINKVIICGICGGTAEPLDPQEMGFGPLIGRVLVSPLSKHGLVSIGGAAFLCYAIEAFGRLNIFFVFSLLALAIVWGILSAFICMSVHNASRGQVDVPLSGDITDWVEDLLLPGIKLLLAGWTIWIPLALYILLFKRPYLVPGLSPVDMVRSLVDPVFIIMALFGILYMPMAVIVAAMEDSVVAVLNPFLVIGLILKSPGAYLVACAMFYSAQLVGAVLSGVAAAIFVLVHLQIFLPGYFHWVISFYTWFLAASALGLLVYKRGESYGLGVIRRPGPPDISHMPLTMPRVEQEPPVRMQEPMKTAKREPIELDDDRQTPDSRPQIISRPNAGSGFATGAPRLDELCNAYLRDSANNPRKVLPPEEMLLVAEHLQARSQIEESALAYRKFGAMFREHPKAAWALLKSAFLSHRLLGRSEEAVKTMEFLIAGYPGSREAAEARKLIRTFGGPGSESS